MDILTSVQYNTKEGHQSNIVIPIVVNKIGEAVNKLFNSKEWGEVEPKVEKILTVTMHINNE